MRSVRDTLRGDVTLSLPFRSTLLRLMGDFWIFKGTNLGTGLHTRGVDLEAAWLGDPYGLYREMSERDALLIVLILSWSRLIIF